MPSTFEYALMALELSLGFRGDVLKLERARSDVTLAEHRWGGRKRFHVNLLPRWLQSRSRLGEWAKLIFAEPFRTSQGWTEEVWKEVVHPLPGWNPGWMEVKSSVQRAESAH